MKNATIFYPALNITLFPSGWFSNGGLFKERVSCENQDKIDKHIG
jgi:hypothetical protein